MTRPQPDPVRTFCEDLGFLVLSDGVEPRTFHVRSAVHPHHQVAVYDLYEDGKFRHAHVDAAGVRTEVHDCNDYPHFKNLLNRRAA